MGCSPSTGAVIVNSPAPPGAISSGVISTWANALAGNAGARAAIAAAMDFFTCTLHGPP